jgi:hypothetical protein
MSERQRGLLLLAMVIVAFVALYRVADDTATSLAIMGFVVARLVRFSWRAREGRTAISQILTTLRTQDRAGREAMLERIPSRRLRGYLKVVLEADGSEEREGDVEQFPYPRSFARRYSRLYWATTVLGAASLLSAAFVMDLDEVNRVVAIGIGVACVSAAWWASRQQRVYASIIEVTPFRLTERAVDGTSRTLLFNRYLELHNDPKKGRAVLTAGGPDRGITLDYRRMAFSRLASLVITYGGFHVEQSVAGT